MTTVEDLSRRIIHLNECKNKYAFQKMKGERILKEDENEMISNLIYLIAEIRKLASEKIEEQSLLNQMVKINDDIKELKKQILFLLNSSPSEIKHEANVSNNVSPKVKNNDEKERTDEIKNRLKQKLTNQNN